LRVLALLNCDFFDEVFKREEEELVSNFGEEIGYLMYNHASLENSFKQKNVSADGKMTSFDDPLLQPEDQRVALSIRKTTSNLVRFFLNPQMQLKLKAQFGETRSLEYAGLIEVFEHVKTLYWTKLTTALEEHVGV